MNTRTSRSHIPGIKVPAASPAITGRVLVPLVAALATLALMLTLAVAPMIAEAQGQKPVPISEPAGYGVPGQGSADDRLCLDCHEAKDAKMKRGHPDKTPEGCLKCHNPHSLKSQPSLPVPSREKCVVCHYQFSGLGAARAKEEREKVHAPVAQGKCSICHQEHDLGKKPEFTAPKDQLCDNCHEKQVAQRSLKSVHKPFANKQCSDCHNPHFSQNKHLTTLPEEQLCTTCHQDRKGEMALPVKHKPYEEGLCSSCHSPHASDYKANLKLDAKKLCSSCHFDRRKDLDKKVVHKPFSEGDCTACHAPHSSRGPKLIPFGSESELCFKCHQSQKAGFKKGSSHAFDGKLSCSSCHFPHASDSQGLSKPDPKSCLECHKKTGKFYLETGHNRVDKGKGKGACSNCHASHNAPNRPLLRGDPIKLCRDCHSSKNYGGHKVGPGSVDRRTGKSMTCITCHSIHGAGYKWLLPDYRGKLCLRCHNFDN